MIDDKYECKHGINCAFVSDYNKDGKRDIVDLTKIQKYLTRS